MKKYIVAIIFALFIATSTFVIVAHAQTSPLNLTHTLRIGSRGDDVALLQGFLLNRKFFNFPSPTRYFGLITKNAVTAFQKAYGIDPVGIAGPITRAKIFELTQQAMQSIQNSTYITTPIVSLHGGTHRLSARQDTTNAIDDADEDGIDDSSDNCPAIANSNQVDSDTDLFGDSCDNCPMVSNVDQADDDTDGIGNACEDEDPPIESFLLTVSKAGAGSGTVTSAPAGISCDGDCSESYDADTVITLTASASAGSTFAGWSGACSGTGTCMVTISSATSVTATFSLTTYSLTVNRVGSISATVTSAPAGINCGSTCSASYTSGTMVTLTASTPSDTTFIGWSGGGCIGTGTCTVNISTSTTVTATFITEA